MSNPEHIFNEHHAFPLTKDDCEYWHSEPPEQIIFATSSKRKALAMAYALHDLSFAGVDLTEFGLNSAEMPLFDNFQKMADFFKLFVSNGDQALEKKVFLGIHQGIPVYADPQSGETNKNDNPKQEAALKAQSVAERYGERKILVVANDTVGISSQLYPRRLGKPSNLLRQIEVNFLAQFGEPLNFPSQQFEEWYIKTLFAVGSTLFHIAEVASIYTEKLPFERTKDYSAEPRGWLSVDLNEEMARHITEIDWDSGMGGVWQLMLTQNPHWLLEQIASHDYLPSLFPKKEEDENDEVKSEEYYLWYVYFWLIGVPIKPLFDAAREDFINVYISQRHAYVA